MMIGRRHRLLVVVAVVFCSGFGSGERLFAPSSNLWERWRAHDDANSEVIDHTAWDVLLRRYIVPGKAGITLFKYRAVSGDDRKSLADYVASLAAVPISKFGRSEQLAYWINFYNALTVKVVLDHYPVKSIRDIDISPGLFTDGPWDKKLVSVESATISLNDIEHRILRPIWRDNRVHYAVNCASIGCPNLQARAFTGSDMDPMLNKGAQEFVNSPRGVSIKDGLVTVSKIYDWFYVDFGESDDDLFRHLLKFAAPTIRERLKAIGNIDNVAYDWRLNDVTR
jgi:hypothetical protein